MFRPSTTISEFALNLAKVIFMLKHSVKLRRYYVVVLQHVMESRVCVACCAECDSASRIYYKTVCSAQAASHN